MSFQINQDNNLNKFNLKKKLGNNKKILIFSSKLYSAYCNLTGFLHTLPDFYLIGSQKSGTTSLFEYLLQHPSIPSNLSKDIRFFDKYYHKGVNWYRLYFPISAKKFFKQNSQNNNFCIGDGTERYLDYPHAAQRIKKLTPNAKLIILLRDPIIRTYSHYNFNVNRGLENRSFEKAIEYEKKVIRLEFEKMLKNPSYYSDDYFRFSYIDRSLYVNKLKRWMKVFPKEQFLILQSEKFFEDPSKVYNQVLKFLNLPKWNLEKYEQFKKQKHVPPKIEKNTLTSLNEIFQPHNRELFNLLGEKYEWEELK